MRELKVLRRDAFRPFDIVSVEGQRDDHRIQLMVWARWLFLWGVSGLAVWEWCNPTSRGGHVTGFGLRGDDDSLAMGFGLAIVGFTLMSLARQYFIWLQRKQRLAAASNGSSVQVEAALERRRQASAAEIIAPPAQAQ